MSTWLPHDFMILSILGEEDCGGGDEGMPDHVENEPESDEAVPKVVIN